LSRPRKLLFVEDSPASSYGGSKRFLVNLCTRLDRNRWAPHVLFYRAGPYLDDLIQAGIWTRAAEELLHPEARESGAPRGIQATTRRRDGAEEPGRTDASEETAATTAEGETDRTDDKGKRDQTDDRGETDQTNNEEGSGQTGVTEGYEDAGPRGPAGAPPRRRGVHRTSTGEVVRSRPRLLARDLRSWLRYYLLDARRSHRLDPFLPEGIDLVHFNGPMHRDYEWAHLARRIGVPLVTRENGVWDRPAPAYRALARRAASVVCLTEERAAQIRRFCGAGVQTDLIPNGVDAAQLVPRRAATEVRAELGLPPGVPLLITAAHFQAWKGQALGIEAAALLAGRDTSFVWTFCGADLEPVYTRNLTRRIEALGLASRVRFLGERHDLPDLFGAADLAIHTAVRPAPFDNVVLEAMAAGTPVVGPNEGADPTVIREGIDGALYVPRDPVSLAEVLSRLLADAETRGRMGQEAAQRIRTSFDLATVVERHSAIYARALGA
jgi:glycosyltransferase involved in cell wall biosynthesis